MLGFEGLEAYPQGVCRNTPANQDMVSHITARGVMNFTHDAKFHGPPSAGCLVNYRFYDEGQPLQEVTLERALSYSCSIRSCLRYVWLDASKR